MVLTKTRISLLVLVPLGMGLLYLGSLDFDAPDAEKRPAPSPIGTLTTALSAGHNEKIAVAETLETIRYGPARELYLETVILQGSAGDKKAAIRELRHLGTTEAVATLSLALADEDPRIRKAAFEALSRVGGEAALAAIASATAASDPVTRARAAEALAMTGGYSAARYLELALHDKDPRVRATAVEALGDLNDGRSVNIISTALRDPDPEVRQRAAEMLDELDEDMLFHALYPAL